MKDVMIDIETLDTGNNAAVLSIGAVYFDRKTGKTGEQFYCRISMDDALSHGSLSDDTLEWWNRQPDEARIEAFGGKERINDAAERLIGFIKPDSQAWGNGSVFDITILENWFRSVGKKAPWDFWNVRDVRTIESWFDINKRDFVRDGTHHNALDDCLFQIKYMCLGAREKESK